MYIFFSFQSCFDGSSEKLNRLEHERNTYELEVKVLKDEKSRLLGDLDKTKKSLGDYAKKNEELLIRITEHRVAEQQKVTIALIHEF